MAPLGLRWPRRRHKVSARLVALSSSAILTVYAAGYLQTRGTDDSSDLETLLTLATATPPAAVASEPTTSPTGTATPAATPTPRVRATPRATVPPPPPPQYRDGSYTAYGRSSHGTVEAEVVIEGGVIVSAEIIGCHTRYPCDEIASLPAQVVELQGLRVKRVSGATDSTMAYVRAVAAALRLATP